MHNATGLVPYTMNKTAEGTAEISLYGEIVSERPKDWRTGQPEEGNFIILSEFLEKLDALGEVSSVTIRIHSVGGNAYDSITIHNRLKSLNAKITVVVDGVAMSGGSLILCAGDVVQVYAGSLIMIHTCLRLMMGYYNAEALHKIATANQGVDRSQAAIYAKKTGKPEAEMLALMTAETYMTGQEAIDAGFADTLLDGAGAQVQASADRKTLFVNGAPFQRFQNMCIPPSVAILQPPNQPTQGGNLMAEPNTPQATPPATEPLQDAVATERQRLQDIDAMAHLFSSELVAAAKYGDSPCTAQQLAYRAAQQAMQAGASFLNALEQDAQASGTAQVQASASTQEEGTMPQTEQQKYASAKAQVLQALGKHKEG